MPSSAVQGLDEYTAYTANYKILTEPPILPEPLASAITVGFHLSPPPSQAW